MLSSAGKSHSKNIFQRISENVEHHKMEAVKKAKYKSTVKGLKQMFLETYESNPRAEHISISEFDRVKTLYQGTHTKIELAMHHETGELFAMKVISKENSNYRAFSEFVTNEKRILKAAVHPFLARMRHHFVDGPQIYIAMDFYPCGDLSSLLKQRTSFSDNVARFYAAQIAMALDFLHAVNVAHLDLKPENVLLDQDGYIRLADMGHAKMFTGRATPGTDANDVDELTYDFSKDWFDLGVILFKMIFGKEIETPKQEKRGANIAVNPDTRYPSCISDDLRDLFDGLLRPKDCTKRLGCTKKGFKAIRKHPWFKSLDWPAIFFKEVEAPFQPNLPPLDCSFKKQFSIRFPKPSCLMRIDEEYREHLNEFLVSVCF